MVNFSSWRFICLYCCLAVSLIPSESFALGNINDSCPYGHRNVKANPAWGGVFACGQYEGSYSSTSIDFEIPAYEGQCYLRYVTPSDCANRPADSSGESGCYPADVDPLTGFCSATEEPKECTDSSGNTYQLTPDKSCSDYCPGSGIDPLTGKNGRGQVHRCNEFSSGEPLSGGDSGSCPSGTIRVGDTCQPIDTGGGDTGGGDSCPSGTIRVGDTCQPIDTGGGDTGGGDTGGGDTGGGDTGGGDTGGGDTGGGETGGGDTGGGDTGGGDTGGGDTGSHSCPIGSSWSDFDNQCVQDDCPDGFYMTLGGCQAIPPSVEPPEGTEPIDLSGVINAIQEQTQQLRADNQTQTTNLVNAENTASQNVVSAINSAKGDIVDAIGNIPGGGGSGTSPNPEPEPSGQCDPESKDYLTCLNKMPLPGSIINDSPSFAASGAAFFERVKDSPIGQIGTDLSDVFDIRDSQCPVLSFDLPPPINRTVATSLHCDIMANIAPLISAIMLIVYSIIGIRIILSS